MYSSHTIQVNDSIKKFIDITQEENGQNIEMFIQPEAAFQK